MSRDGKGERIPRSIVHTEDRRISFACGGELVGDSSHARYRRCSLGHVHCTQCHRIARKHRKTWTCGKCPGMPPEDQEARFIAEAIGDAFRQISADLNERYPY